VVIEKKCRERREGHEHEKNDVDPKQDTIITQNESELFVMQDPKNSKSEKAYPINEELRPHLRKEKNEVYLPT
jgi:hypothetical protein